MSANVFGNPVTDSTVSQINIGITNITARDRAEVALTYMNADSKANDADTYVRNLKQRYGDGTATLCNIYNATGGTLTFISNHTWEGTVWQAPYPQIIQNGQWGAFLHVRGRLMGPSKEGIVYRGQNNDGLARDWLLAWNTERRHFQNRVYTEVRTTTSLPNWNTVNDRMNQQTLTHSSTGLGCFSTVSTGAGSSPKFVGIMTLQGLTPRASDLNAIFPSLDSEYNDDEGVEDDADDVATPA